MGTGLVVAARALRRRLWPEETKVTAKIAMTQPEAISLRRHLARSRRYLEFGCGGSTILAAESPARVVVSVESDTAWIERTAQHPGVAARLASGTLTFHPVDIGPTKQFGHPADDATALRWPAYHQSVWEGNGSFDLILVDGRFRVACALMAIVKSRPGTTILIHDFERTNYHDVLHFADCVEQVERLAAIRVRRWGVDWRALATAVVAYSLDPR